MDEMQLMWPQPADDDPRLPRGRFLMRRIDDRWNHEIGLEQGNRNWTYCASATGSADAIWPASPPLQQLSREQHGGTAVILGLGMAGQSHWSASLEPTSSGIRIEYACRTHGTPEFIGSTYETKGTVDQIDEDGLVLSLPESPHRLRISALETATLTCNRNSGLTTEILIIPREHRATTSWAFEFERFTGH